ncbi:hypothetical protein [Occultella kanbiaonis]|uniref:hypothetical protein n=1 Tax=Occultella kanbiaonis TaxID=2675754 RepID=UPI0013D1FC53|nr:hypothetical protein [Occultella kanbiaonis]
MTPIGTAPTISQIQLRSPQWLIMLGLKLGDEMDRRTMLRMTVLAAGAGTGMAWTSSSSAGAQEPEETVDRGPATLACTTLSGGFVGDRPYIVSHLLQPVRLGVFTPAADQIVDLVEIPSGGGAWASLVDAERIYVGTHTVADLYAFDTTTHRLDKLAGPAGATYIWDMTRTSDGTIFLGTYPDGKVWEYRPADNALIDRGVAVAGQKYVRSIIADDTTVYAGVGAQAGLVAYDRGTGTRTDITPPELSGEAFIYQLTQTDSHVIGGTHGSGVIAIISKADPGDYRIVHPDSGITIGKMAAQDDDVYYGAGDSLWHLDLTTGVAEAVGATAGGDFITAVSIRATTVAVFTNSATMWTYDRSTGAMSMADLQAAGMPSAPDLPQSIAVHADNVYVGGHGGFQIHHRRAPAATDRVRLGGEVKAMQAVRNTLYLAMYPSATIVAYNPTTGALNTIASIGHDQNRPGDITYHRRSQLLLVPTSPGYGQLGGALSTLDLRTRKLDVYRNLVENHALVSVAAHERRGLAYVGSAPADSSYGPATVAIFDLGTRTRVGTTVPDSAATSIPSLVVLRDSLYGTTNDGLLFRIDTRSGELLRTAEIGTARVDLTVSDDVLYAVDHQRLWRIDPTTLSAETLVHELAADPTSFPMVAAVGTDLFTITGRNLLQVSLHSVP